MLGSMFEMAHKLRGELQPKLPDEAVRGAVLEADPFWLANALWPKRKPGPDAGCDEWYSAPWRALAPIEVNEQSRPGGWGSYCKANGWLETDSPFRIKVALKHPIPGGNLPTRILNHPISYEVRAPLRALGLFARMAEAFGTSAPEERFLSVGRNDPPSAGTLSGVLHHRGSGRVFGVSCAHVLGHPGTVTFSPGPYPNEHGVAHGTVCFSSLPQVKTPGMPCNLFAQPQAETLDVAATEILPSRFDRSQLPSPPSAIRPPETMSPLQPVFFVGKQSGYREAVIGGTTLWHEVEFHDGVRCFGTLFQLLPPPGERRPLAVPGDSGAWVMDRADAFTCWDGIVMASDGSSAFACYSGLAKAAIDNALGPTGLQV
jgi:hypothetical protein